MTGRELKAIAAMAFGMGMLEGCLRWNVAALGPHGRMVGVATLSDLLAPILSDQGKTDLTSFPETL